MRSFRRRLSGPASAVILGYHRVGDPGVDPHRLAVSPENFAAQMRMLRERWTPLALTEIADASARRDREPPVVALTFDDGYADNLTVALPVLEEVEVPATFFATVGNVLEGRQFWWESLAALLLGGAPLPTVDVRLPDGVLRFDLTTSQQRRTAHDELQQLLVDQSPATIADVISQLTGLTDGAGSVRPDAAPMTTAQLELLAASPVASIGSHGMTHGNMTVMGHNDLATEAQSSKSVLEQVTGAPVVAFSYPFGFVNDEAVAAVRTAGYTAACAIGGGAPRRSSDPFRLGRLLVRDWPAGELEMRMRQYLRE